MTLRIHTSNRMETLVEQLAGVVCQPLPSVFDPEIIVVQSKGMQRWLAMELAQRTGIWANGRFPFPNAIIDNFFSCTIPDLASLPDLSSFNPEVLIWRIMELLPSFLGCPGFEQVTAYLAGDINGLKRLQFAGAIADTFDQYTLYRPEMIMSWERGEGDGWQPHLWRQLSRNSKEPHRASLLMQFRRQLGRNGTVIRRLPHRLSLIGIPALPPFHMEVLTAIAGYTEVNLFLLNPCREYWGAIVSEKELARKGQQEFDFSGGTSYFEAGNPLLASFGRVGKDFFETLISDCGEVDYADTFVDPGEDCLLHAIQGDILQLRDRRKDGGSIVPQGDDSLRIHSCHSAMREVEVLYDQLLHRLDCDPTLSPRDILVMTPDIESYAPYISAVFGSPERPEQRLPFSIADRSLRRETEAGEAFLAILGLCGSRFSVTQVMDILETAMVLRRYALSKSDLDPIREWVSATNIRWGIDAGTRREHGLPPFAENSWQAGLDRLLLGYAMAGNDHLFFADTLPYDHVEGGNTQELGHFLEFCSTLFARANALAQPRSLDEWTATLRTLVSLFFEAGDEGDERQLADLSAVIDGLGESAAKAAYTSAVSIEVVRAWLEEKLDKQQAGFGFLTGGVTFCAMLPMRSIPFRVIALLGMNDGVFPRRNRSNGFDLIAATPRRGDRNQRDEDRYLFLEALLSARDHFSISYIGQNIKDNSELPPSVLVAELLDYCGRSFRIPGQEEIADRTVIKLLHVRHPLQPFNTRYFCGNELLFSYSQENLGAVVAANAPRTEAEPFLRQSLPDNKDATVNIQDLIGFFANPCKYLLRRQLGLYLDQRHQALDEEEPFAIDQLCKYALEQEMVATLVKGEDLQTHCSVARSRGELPPGQPGLVLYNKLAAAATEFADQVTAVAAGPAMAPLEIELDCDGIRLLGRVEGIWPTGLVHYRYAKLKAKDRLRMWIEYLCLNCVAPADYPRSGFLLASDAILTALPVAVPRSHLEKLLTIYRRGLTSPLHFFPGTSLEYAKKMMDPKKEAKALADAAKKWHGSEEYPGEKDDVYFQRCFGQGNPLNEDFMQLSRTIYEPLLAHLCEKKSKRGEKQ